MKSVCVFCGSAPGAEPAYLTGAAAVGTAIARRGLQLVYGGGSSGLMGAVANAALAAGGEVVGVMPRTLTVREVQHRGLTAFHEVDSMHARKALMAEMSDGFLVLPGGFGTLDEFCEILTWAQLGLHDKPIALLNTQAYFDALLTFFDHALQQGFVSSQSRARIKLAQTPDALLDLLSR